jgi:GNAT superfamily N-acetyltransferase
MCIWTRYSPDRLELEVKLVKWSGKLIVHLDFQNRGIGTRLMNEIEKRFDQAERYELFTGCRSERNLYLYQKLGYEPFRSERATDKVTLTFLEKR